MSIGLKIQGLDQLLKRVERMSVAVREEVNEEMLAGAYEMNNEAINNIRRNNSIGFSGGLIRDQQVVRVARREFEVKNSAPYAPFVEFGTGRRANPPAEWAAYAATFKGKRIPGPGGDFFERIVMWVKAKGLTGRYSTKTRRRLGSKATKDKEDRELAYFIWRSILVNGAHPHPFQYPAFKKVGPQIVINIKRVIRRSIKQ